MTPALPEDFEDRLACHRAAEAAEGPPTRRAAVAAVLRGPRDARELLLMRRIEYPGDPWSGHISLPGGSLDPEDVDLFHTAVRETREEVGLDLPGSARFLCRLESFHAVAGTSIPPMDITPFVFRLEAQAEASPGSEAQECFWLPLEEVLSGQLDTQHRHARQGVVRMLPAWRFGERVVWGMTYRMIQDVLRAGGAPLGPTA
jgi:8-oxo-dGTP pyrophosphatase MutT (NUDIX family)